MLDIIIGFAATTVLTWFLFLVGIWILEKIALLTGSDFFRISIRDWMYSWKSWAFVAGFVFLCTLAGI